MKADQRFLPAYWVVNDKTTDDVIIETARKNREECVKAYIEMLSDDIPKPHFYEDAAEMFYGNDNLEVILVKIQMA